MEQGRTEPLYDTISTPHHEFGSGVCMELTPETRTDRMNCASYRPFRTLSLRLDSEDEVLAFLLARHRHVVACARARGGGREDEGRVTRRCRHFHVVGASADERGRGGGASLVSSSCHRVVACTRGRRGGRTGEAVTSLSSHTWRHYVVCGVSNAWHCVLEAMGWFPK